MGEQVRVGDIDMYVDRRGRGDDVLLIGGLGDTTESWQFQIDGLADRYHLIAYDMRGAARSPDSGGPLSLEVFADDAAGLLEALDVPAAHVAAFSGGSVTAQHLALRHPERVRSLVLCSTWARPDAYTRSLLKHLRWLMEVAPSERAFLEAFFLWIYTPRAHEDGWVAQTIEEVLAFPHKQTTEDLQRSLDAFGSHDALERLGQIDVPTLVIAGGVDIMIPPRLGRVVAEAIPGARFQLLPDEAHQPFQEIPEEFNRMVAEFWQEVDAR